MNPYDKAQELVKSIRDSEEVKSYLKMKEEIFKDDDCKELISEFRNKQVEVQSLLMQGQEADSEKMEKLQSLYQILVANPNVKDFFDKEVQFDEMLSEIYRIISDVIKDIHE
jgi:cell fate (sporulation/competence/biofilm development) regulator YlbF (YheA/YmcA/DUF963 family)